MKLLMYGAGSIGRGFIGPLFSNAGYEVVFVDVDRCIIEEINRRKGYNYTVAAQPPFDVRVSGVRAVDGSDEYAVIEEIAECDIMATALGAAALQKVAHLIARGISLRLKRTSQPLNILICENLKNAPGCLRGWLNDAMQESDKKFLNEKCGMIETAIGRMVPVTATEAIDPLHIVVEEYDYLPVDRDAFVGDVPEVPGLIACSPFAYYTDRKMYLHNMGHAVCAYLGIMQGYSTIADAISDPGIRILTQSAMTEAAAMLSLKYKQPFTRVYDHAEDLLLRFSNKALGDTCRRVSRNTIQKISSGERFTGALCLCREHNIYPAYIALGYASALYNITADKGKAESLARETGGLSAEQIALVMNLYCFLKQPIHDIISEVERVKYDLRGSVV